MAADGRKATEREQQQGGAAGPHIASPQLIKAAAER